ncbi:hypothetical protein EJ06DRAFT_256467 [Trichodelitschia bisporula]|uniref:Uncharacterized protein n=1 Tax=Trichodelitschia bisporula TaxID=703511 RepID=A0A6G1HIL5_9PEZI|nr:hypothetical protein EJ06DRAFT_256467 [Trichodelitschia bisporula]
MVLTWLWFLLGKFGGNVQLKLHNLYWSCFVSFRPPFVLCSCSAVLRGPSPSSLVLLRLCLDLMVLLRLCLDVMVLLRLCLRFVVLLRLCLHLVGPNQVCLWARHCTAWAVCGRPLQSFSSVHFVRPFSHLFRPETVSAARLAPLFSQWGSDIRLPHTDHPPQYSGGSRRRPRQMLLLSPLSESAPPAFRRYEDSVRLV